MTKYYSEEEIKTKAAIRSSILKMTGSSSRNVSGTLACPVCGGTIRWRIGRTSHVSAVCNTQGCIKWDEKPGRFI